MERRRSLREKAAREKKLQCNLMKVTAKEE